MVVPVEVLLGRRGEEREQARGVGAERADQLVGVHDVALGLGHLRAILDDHPLGEERRERLVHPHEPEVAEHLRVEARVEQVQDRVLDAADVLVHGHPVLRRGAVEHAGLVARRAVAEEIPGRLDERVHRVRLAPRPAAAPGTARVDEARGVGERRGALARELDVAREHDGQVRLGLRDHPARVAVEDGDGRAPVALAADAPVAQPVVHPCLAEPVLDEPVDGLPLGRRDREAVEEPRVDLHAVARVGLTGPAVGPRDGLDDGEPVRLREVPVALVLAGDGHDGAGAVAHQHVVGDEQRDRGPAERVHDAGGEPEAALGSVGGEALDLRLARDLRAERGDGGALARVADELVDERVLGGEHRVRHPEDRVGAGREDAEREIRPADHGQVELGALAPADPVALHRQHALGPPREAVAPGEQLVGVRGDLEEPPVELLGRDLRVAAPAPPVLDLLVGEHCLAGRAPVDGRAPPVREAALEHPDEDELLPLVVGGVARGELAVPVVGDAHPPELRAHVVDVLVGPDGGVHAVLDRRVLGGQAEGVPAHRVEHVVAAHPLVPGEQVADGVDADVAHVDAARGVREHLEAVELRAARILGDRELLALLPGLLPPGLDLAEGVAVTRHNWARVLHT